MTSIEDLTNELISLDQFLQSDTFRAFQSDLDIELKAIRDAVFESVPQTDGDVRDREQKMGCYTYIETLQSWFADRREAVKDTISDTKIKHDITP